MSLLLDLSYVQSNDAVTLQLTDEAGTYVIVDNPGGWEIGAATNPDVNDIVAEATTTAGKHHLYLDISVTNSSNVTTAYDQINLYDHDTSGPFAVASDLVWTFTPADLIATVAGTPMGAATDELVNGIYEITLSLLDANTAVAAATALNEKILVDGAVRKRVYHALRDIPDSYDDIEETEPTETGDFIEIKQALLKYGLFRGMLANVSNATISEVINTLDTLERLTVNDV